MFSKRKTWNIWVKFTVVLQRTFRRLLPLHIISLLANNPLCFLSHFNFGTTTSTRPVFSWVLFVFWRSWTTANGSTLEVGGICAAKANVLCVTTTWDSWDSYTAPGQIICWKTHTLEDTFSAVNWWQCRHQSSRRWSRGWPQTWIKPPPKMGTIPRRRLGMRIRA